MNFFQADGGGGGGGANGTELELLMDSIEGGRDAVIRWLIRSWSTEDRALFGRWSGSKIAMSKNLLSFSVARKNEKQGANRMYTERKNSEQKNNKVFQKHCCSI